MGLHVETNSASWNRLVKMSPYAVSHHKHEVLSFSNKTVLPLIYEKRGDYILFPFNLSDNFGFRFVTVPVNDVASLLPNSPEAFSLLPEALDVVSAFLRRHHVDLLTVTAPFLLPRSYEQYLDDWFKARSVSVQVLFMDLFKRDGRSFESVWKSDFSKHARNRARKADKEGVEVREVEVLENWISDMYLCNMSSFHRQQRHPRYPHSDERAFLVYLNKHKELLGESFKVYGAFVKGRLVAYSATLEFNQLILVMLMMSLSEFMSKCPNDTLLRHLVQHACKDRFNWIYYSFDRVSHESERPSLHTTLRRFKFERGFREFPMKIYSLGLSRSGKFVQRLLSFYNFMFVSSAAFPPFVTDTLQKVYEMQRYRKSRYSYVKDTLS
ncbi:MAG: GNAT family N-acetyltransferase [Candidatus Bathyarchaeota archaeon]|nr:MAG: GNAT family N-acetyltransferase [Candidatus Bathyarchaeota archaeon]